jgi:DNA processing protein
MNDIELISAVQLSRTQSIGAIMFRRLIQRYKTASKALEALPMMVRQKPITIFPRERAIEEIEKTLKLKGKMISILDDRYPSLLKEIEDAPPIISILGSLEIFIKPSIGIVGSRNSSLNARKLSYILAENLGKQNFVIDSGLARGIDTSAHEGSLKTGTIAVIAGGVDIIYPRENETLYHQIIDQGGAIISEAPLTMQPLAQHFPKRNRIITGLSNGVIVVEAGERSGSLISARTASEQGRAVMAVPGFPSDPRSIGTNDLIRNGVILIRNAEDVMEELENYKFRQSQPKNNGLLCENIDEFYDFETPSSQDSEKITDLLLSNISIAPCNIDEILRSCQLSSQDVQAILFELELSGIVQRLPGNRICRIA